uniref:Senescence domain-containing protein n=1 Tax=Salix viminalis TaxID=40686 RepID=A0A6N2KZK8_SALVM
MESATILLSLEGYRVQMLYRRQGDINCNFYKDWDSSVGTIDELHLMGRGKLKLLESYNISDVEEGLVNSADQFAENTDSLIPPVEPEITSTIDITPENPSLGSDDVMSGGASEAVDDALSKIFSTFDQTGELVGDRLTSFSSGLREATKKAAGTSVDVLGGAIIAVEESITKGTSFVVYSHGSAKDLLPPEIRDALNLSEERVTEIDTEANWCNFSTGWWDLAKSKKRIRFL